MLHNWSRSSRWLAASVIVCVLSATSASAQYATRFSGISNGAITFTGNALGLDGESSQNGQGTRGAIGTFIATAPALRDITPPPTSAPPFPFGTTSDWRLNGSQAVLRLPAGARVLRAELIWGGTFAGNSAADNVSAFINGAIVFTTPAGTFNVSPDPATAKQVGSVAGTGTCNGCFYVRSANVTGLVAAGGAGTYRTGAVPATQGTTDNNNPSAGWTLAVVYEDFNQPIRNLSLFLGLERSGGAAASVSGFCTPTSGPLSGRLAVTAMEGDARITGDQMLFGDSVPLSSGSDRVQGPRNPRNNFFSGQVTGDDGNLDTSGTFGTRNHTPDAPVDGGRQGWDITNVDVSARLNNNQTTAFAQGTTTGDAYHITALALQIDVGAPTFRSEGASSVDRTTAAIGDVLTYTVLIDNSAGTTNATNVVFFDTLPAGMSFIANSFSVNGVTQAGANPITGVPLGTVAVGTTRTVRFQARVDSVIATHLRVNRARWTFEFVSCAGQAATQGVSEANDAVTVVPVADLAVSKTLLGTPVAGAPFTYSLVVRNDGPSPVSGATVVDPGSTPALLNQSWTCVGGTDGSSCPASGSGPINVPVTIFAGGTVTFTITGTLPANSAGATISNSATVTPPAAVPDFDPSDNTASVSTPISASADLRVSSTGPPTAQRGGTITRTITVTNDGPSDALNVVLTKPTPPGLTLVTPISGPCAAAPGCSIPAGTSQTLTITFGIPADYSGPDPIVHGPSVTGSTPDPSPANNSASSHTALDADVVDLTLTKTNGTTQVTPGLTTTYTITITNAGPAAAVASRVVDQLDPSSFTDVQWQCTASGTSSCSAVGPQSGNIDTLIDVDPGAENAVVFTVQALVLGTVPGMGDTPPGTVSNTATVTAASGVGEADDADNMATDSDAARTVSDLSFTKTGPATIVPGTTVEYTVTVTSAGPSVVRDVIFVEVPEEGTAMNAGVVRPELIESVQAPADSRCEISSVRNSAGNTFDLPVCTIPLLEPGQSRDFLVRLAIPADFEVSGGPLAITNSAQLILASVDDDPDFEDLAGAVTSMVQASADVVVVKTGPGAVVAGNIASYFVDVSNNGPSVARNVVAQDVLPAGLAVVDSSGACAAAFVAGSPCSIGVLMPGQHVTTRIDVLVPADYAGAPTLLNTATATADGDPESANNSASVSTLVVPDHADVGVTLTAPASVPAGGTLTVGARVTNFGPGPAFNVTLSASIPGGSTVIGRTLPPNTTCTTPTTGVTNLSICVTPVLLPGEFLDFSRTLQIDSSVAPGSILSDLVTVSSTTPGHNPNNNQDVTTIRVTDAIEAGVSIQKTDNSDPVVTGANVTYTLTVRNAGPSAATNVTVVDTLPAEMTLVSATPSQGSCAAATCTLGTIAAGATATVTIVAGTSSPGVFTNTATVTATEPDPILSNNTVTHTTTVANADQADLMIQKIGSTVESPGSTTFYTIIVTNRGPVVASNVEVADTLPAGLIFVGNSGACSTSFPCRFDALEPGASVVIFTAFTVDPSIATPTTVVNSASVSSSVADPDPGNNTSTISTDIDVLTNTDLAVTKVDSPDAVRAGTRLSYGLSVLNRGPGVATDVVLTDVLPPGVTLISATTTRGTCSGTTTVTCALGALTPATDVAIGIVVAVSADATSLTNTASATSSSPDPNQDNNSRTEVTTVLPAVADLSVTKVLTTPPIPGLAGSYQILVTNTGPSDIIGAGVADAFPAAVGSVTWTCVADPGSACGAAAGSGAIAATVNLQSGDSAMFVATGTIAAGATGVLANTVTVTAPGGAIDPNPANNVATSSVALTPLADLQVSKSGPAQATPGTTLTFTIAVTNAGPSDAVDVTLSDPTPAGLTFVGGGGACASYPCALGTVPAGATITATATFAIPSGYTTPDPIANTATVSSASTPDPAGANNTATAMSSIAAPITDLGIGKTNGVSTVVPGGTTTYTITVTNAGPSNAINATVTDIFPAALSGVSWTCSSTSGGVCSAATGSGDINTAVSIPAGGSVIFTATATIAADAVGVLVNTATVTPGPGASDPSSANNTDVDTVTPEADVAIVKTGPTTVVPGDSLVYTIVVTNNGPSNAENVVVEDPTPADLVFVSNGGACTTAFPCNLGTVPAGATRTITATFDRPSEISAPAPVVNVATVSSTTPDPDLSNNSSEFETTLNLSADVDITTTVTPASGVLVGDTVVITVTALNRGPNPATAVAVTANLPAGLELVSSTPTQGGYDPVTGSWDVGDVANAATAQLTLTLIVRTPGAITTLAVKTGQNEPDPSTSNDSAAATFNAAPAADLAVEKIRSVSEPLVGETVTFVVRLTNRGPSGATAVTLEDALPAGLTFVSATPTQGAYDAMTGLWAAGDLAPLGEATLTLIATVDEPGPLSNSVRVASLGQIDPNPLNDLAAASINAVPNADLQVAKAVSNPSPPVGTDVTFTIAVTNLGPSAASSAEILDRLPSGVTFVSATASAGAYAEATGIWTLGAIPVSATETLSIVGRVTQLGAITNTAARQSSAPVDPNPVNDGAAAAATPSVVADVTIIKTPSVTTVVAGGTVTWTIVVTNGGPSAVSGATVADALPPQVTGVQWTCTPSAGAACSVASGAGPIAATVSLPAGGTATFVVTGVVSPSATGILDSVATVAVPVDVTDSNPANNSANGPVQVSAIGDLEVTATGPASVTPGTTAIYTVTVTNRGPSVASDATLVAPTPDGVTLEGVSGACTTLPCALGGIPPGESRTIAISYAVPLDYPTSNPIVVTMTANSPADTNQANNSVTITTAVSQLADVSIVKSGPVSSAPGRTITYSLLIANAGPAAAEGVVVDDPTPTGVTFVSASAPCAGGFPCALGSLPSGTTVTVTVTLRVPPGGFVPGTTVTNRATVTATTGDPVPNNNSSNVVTALRRIGCDVNGDGRDELVTGAGPGGGPHVRVFNFASTSTELVSFYAYPQVFTGGVSVACGDLDNDGLADIVTGAGPGGGPHVRVFSLAGGLHEIASFYAYDPAFPGGVHVAVGDVTGDGLNDIVTGAGPGGGPHVRAIRVDNGVLTEVVSFYAYDTAFTGGVHVAAGDVDGDGQAEMITGAGPSGGPHVRVIRLDDATLTEVASFYAFEVAFDGGVRVAAGDLDGDGLDEVITGAGPSGGPHVRAFKVSATAVTELTSFYAYDPAFTGGVWVGAGDVNGNGPLEIVTGAGESGGPHVRIIEFDNGTLTELGSFYAYNPLFDGGVTVASAAPAREPAGRRAMDAFASREHPTTIERATIIRAAGEPRWIAVVSRRAAARSPPARAGPLVSGDSFAVRRYVGRRAVSVIHAAIDFARPSRWAAGVNACAPASAFHDRESV